ncbi:MAG: LytTR family DNA-binding domain-containing protein [Bacteroidales bacterium]
MLKAIAIDDEPLALQLVSGYIRKTPFLELVATFDNPLSAMEFLENNSVDIVFLDIQMPDLKGTEFAGLIKQNCKIIFTTAYEKYAIEGFRLDATDYLLKPFGYEDFLRASNKAKKLIELESGKFREIEANSEFLFLKSEYKIRRINLEEILYIEGLKDYIKIYLYNETKPVLSINTMKAIEAKLPDDKFMRVHRSFIVNLKRIQTIDRSRIVFGETYIPVSEQYAEKFKTYLNRSFL